MNSYIFQYMFYPNFYNNCNLPPTLYSIMQSIVNYHKKDKTKVKDLSKEARKTIFNFDYPLSDYVSREEFECNILNHFIQRRINYETMTMFNLQLNSKLNEIMPKYNIMFNSVKNWNLFEDGESVTRTLEDKKTSESTNNSNDNTTTNINNIENSKTSNSLTNKSTTESNNTSYRRFSELPNSNIEDVKNGNYITNYNFDTNNDNVTDNSESSSKSENNSTTENTQKIIRDNSNESKTNDNTNVLEIIKKSQNDRLSLLLNYQNEIKSIYSMIYNDLEPLFFQIL